MTTATAPIRADIRGNRLQQGLGLWYLFFWAMTGISPVDRQDWLLENFLVLVFSSLLIATYRRFPLSDLSYVLIVVCQDHRSGSRRRVAGNAGRHLGFSE